jgi:hypothetical protein
MASRKKHHNTQSSRSSQSKPAGQSSQKSKPVNKKKVVKKERGFWLGLILVLIVVHGLAAALFYYYVRVTPAFELSRPWIITLASLHFLANAVAAVAIWFWKKWGWYIYMGSAVLGLVLGLVTVGIWSAFYMILPLAILGYVLRNKWYYFEN